MNRSIAAGVVGVGLALAGFPQSAEAGGGYGGRHYGGYGSYYGNGGHDFQPHWHTTRTRFGTSVWFGNGPHDYQPHGHSYSPWGYRGYHATPYGFTTSYYPRSPYYYAPW